MAIRPLDKTSEVYSDIIRSAQLDKRVLIFQKQGKPYLKKNCECGCMAESKSESDKLETHKIYVKVVLAKTLPARTKRH